MSKGIIHPDNIVKAVWDFVGLLFILYQSVLSPYRICFNEPAKGGMGIFEIFQDFYFIVDIILSFNSGTYEDGSIVMLRIPITITYLKMWFWIDLIASFPYSLVLSGKEYFYVFTEYESSSEGVRR